MSRDDDGTLIPDAEQQAAIDSDEPSIAVLAGPGSGKTLVLAQRARRLLDRDRQARALLLTFTNKAAAEMKARVLEEASVSSDRVTANTFHTFSMHVLRSHGDLIGIAQDFALLDDEQRKTFCADLYERTRIVDQYGRWSYLRVRRLEVREPLVRDFGAAYSDAKRTENVLDFDDLVVGAAELLEARPDIAAAYSTQYPHVLVDEFQDTNAAQFAIIRALTASAASVSVFADDDQAIYQFAGAESDNVRRFVAELGATTYPLTVNYRCRSEIVAHANRLIAADRQASGRQMQAYHQGGSVRLASFATADEEARVVSAEIAGLVGAGDARPWHIAVLGRSSARLAQILTAIQQHGIPTSNWLAGSYASQERNALRVCLSLVRGRLSDFQARQLFQFLNSDDTGERDPERLLAAEGDTPSTRALQQVREAAWRGAPVSDVVAAAENAALLVNEDLAEGFRELREAVEAFHALDPDFSLEQLDAELALRSSGPPTVGGGVKVASLHRTKGLQWPRVYLLGLEQGCLPDYRSDSGEKLREERRTCFVGVTRAEQHLVLTRLASDRGWVREPSVFLREMGL